MARDPNLDAGGDRALLDHHVDVGRRQWHAVSLPCSKVGNRGEFAGQAGALEPVAGDRCREGSEVGDGAKTAAGSPEAGRVIRFGPLYEKPRTTIGAGWQQTAFAARYGQVISFRVGTWSRSFDSRASSQWYIRSMAEPAGRNTGPDVTTLLRAWSAGDRTALDQLLPILHGELKRIARRYMRRERQEHTLQPTALVNEAFLRLVDLHGIGWQDRAHFFALSAQMMRRILVNYALARAAGKRGAAVHPVPLDEGMIVSPERDSELVELDEALQSLAKFDPRKAQVVELRFFAGLSVEETAAVLKVSPQTVLRDWSLSKTWLAREMGRAAGA
jgi:RNA polymerase sigma factor (TIGR02999 family)